MSRLQTITDCITALFNLFLDQVQDIVDLISEEGNEIFLVFLIIPLVSIGISLIKSLLGMKANKE